MASGKFISYLRVSTERQGRSGLGLEGQREAVRAYLNGGHWTLLGEFQDVESGKRSDNRPELLKALELAKLTGGTLLIARLDRLSRNAAFLMTLRDTGVAFVAVDMPSANNLTIGVMSLVAQQEREAVSARTKAALGVIKAMNKPREGKQPIGRRKGEVSRMSDELMAQGRAAQAAKADEMAGRIARVLRTMPAGMSLRGQAAELTARGILTARGGAWTATAVRNVMARASEAA